MRRVPEKARGHAPAATLDDAAAVARVLGGDTALFEILMRRYNQRMFRIAQGVVADADEAEDVVQEAFLRSYDQLASFRAEASFATWLGRITLHEALARVKKRRRFVLLPGGEEPEAPESTGASPEAGTGNTELAAVLRRAVEALPEGLRVVFVLREIEGLGTEEVAELLDLSSANVRVRFHRARTALRRSVDDQLGSETRRLYLFAGTRCDRVVSVVMARIGERQGR